MLWSPYALETQTELWFGMVWAWMLWSPYALGTRTELWFGHGCSGHPMLHIKKTCISLDGKVTPWLILVAITCWLLLRRECRNGTGHGNHSNLGDCTRFTIAIKMSHLGHFVGMVEYQNERKTELQINLIKNE